MFDLLTKEEDEQAAARGWSLEYVFDCATNRLVVAILPKQFKPPFVNGETMVRAVVAHARTGDRLSARALKLLMRGPVTQTRKKK